MPQYKAQILSANLLKTLELDKTADNYSVFL